MEQNQQPQELGSQVPAPQKTGMGLEPNIAGALSYFCGWVTGLIFFLMEKENKFVRFHAMQSLILSGVFIVLYIALSILGNIPFLGWLTLFAYPVLGILGLIVWILMMVKAYQGEKFKLPVIGDIAEKNT